MKRKLIVSIDVERDIVRYLGGSYLGIDLGMPSILAAIRDSGFVPDLFVESSIAERNPELLREAVRSGCLIACHGKHVDPAVATELKHGQLKAHMLEGIESIRRAIGQPPLAYREANFAVDSRTLALLIDLGIRVDSSVLPDRIVRSHGIMPLVDHRDAPNEPYRPGLMNHTTAGISAILEVPVTNNPKNLGAPIGTGFLNWKGIDETLTALRSSKGNPAIFLVHPWECVDLGRARGELPNWVTEISRDNCQELAKFLVRSLEWFVPSTLREAAAEFGVSLQ